MKVHFITSRTSLEKDIDSLRRVVTLIHDAGHVLADEWLEEAYELLVQKGGTRGDWSVIFKSRIEAISKADVVIAEASYENFGVGYQVAMSVQQKKPILLLRHKSANKNAFATGIVDKSVDLKDYDENNVEEIVKGFLAENDIQTKDMRFNFFIDREIYNYLRWSSIKTGKTKAEILRDLVSREIHKQDDSI